MPDLSFSRSASVDVALSCVFIGSSCGFVTRFHEMCVLGYQFCYCK